MSLAEFLRARIAEDEASAGNWLRFEIRDGVPGNYAIAERVLAECEAKRRIVAVLEEVSPVWDDLASGYSPEDWLAKRVALALAIPYADHSDYRPEWRPDPVNAE